MKKMILMTVALLLLAVPAVKAQKLNAEGILQKLEKSNAEIVDVKKNTKASTWLNRGKVYYEAAMEPTKNLFPNMEVVMMKLANGEPQSTEEVTIDNKKYTALVYNYYTAYIQDSKMVSWKQTKEIQSGLIDVAIEAYNKAYELDPKVAEKVKIGMQQISDYCSQVGNVGTIIGEYANAADGYETAFKAQSNPAYGKADSTLLYYAGYLMTVDGPKNPASFIKGEQLLKKALDLGFVDEEGAIYYYLFHSYYGQKGSNPDAITNAKQALLTGIEKFPKNEKILDGLMQLYTSEEGIGNPADLVALIDAAIEREPQNVDLWFGRGRTFYAIKNYDQSIESFKKVTELKPDMFEGWYYLGIFYVVKGDELNIEMGKKTYTSMAASEADLKVVSNVYAEAIPIFEKALEVKPEDVDTVGYLKNLYFRMRDEPGMMDKYNYYEALLNKLKGGAQ